MEAEELYNLGLGGGMKRSLLLLLLLIHTAASMNQRLGYVESEVNDAAADGFHFIH